MEGEKGYGERSARHKRAWIGPTCFGFEEVQPAKSSLRDVESSSFLFLFLSLSFYPSFSFSTIRFIFLFVRRFYSFLPPFVTALPPLIHLGRSGTLFMQVYASTPVLS